MNALLLKKVTPPIQYEQGQGFYIALHRKKFIKPIMGHNGLNMGILLGIPYTGKFSRKRQFQ